VPEVIDLDVIKPPAKIIKLGGKQIDVSFIPTGITFEIDEITQKLVKYTVDQVQEGGAEAREAFDLSVRLCATFCKIQHEELDEEWFKKHTSPDQIEQLAQVISETLQSSFEAMEAYQKNAEKAEVKKAQ
tara:strand:+ start:1545 stop:1934 length:390 start_codon:yes stop_codon:yes gene_type:complete